MHRLWALRAYVRRDSDVLREWYDGEAAVVRATFSERIEYLLQNERAAWTRPPYGVLTGDGAGLGEVRLKANRVQHRLIGFVAVQPKAFTVLFCAVERDRQFVPRDACAIAQRRRAEIDADGRMCRDCDWF